MEMRISINYYIAGSLPTNLVAEGLQFIRECFLDVWGVFRCDVNLNDIRKRDNVVILKDDMVLGWLGVEDDGELTNACVSKELEGVKNLISMIKKTYEMTTKESYYAETPLLKSGSARAFLSCGMLLTDPIEIRKIKYAEKDIELVKMELSLRNEGSISNTTEVVENSLLVIKEITENDTDNSKRN